MNLKKGILQVEKPEENPVLERSLKSFEGYCGWNMVNKRGHSARWVPTDRGQITEDLTNSIKELEFYTKYERKPLEDWKQMSEMFWFTRIALCLINRELIKRSKTEIMEQWKGKWCWGQGKFVGGILLSRWEVICKRMTLEETIHSWLGEKQTSLDLSR